MAITSRLALGTVQFGLAYGIANRTGQPVQDDVVRIIRRAGEAGMDTLDTAVAYGNAERSLGEVGVHGWRIVTKLPPLPEGASAATWVASQIGESLARLRVERVYGLMLHQPAALFGSQGAALFRAMSEARRNGLVEKIGISAYGPEEIRAVAERFRIDIVQAPFNVIDRRIHDSGCLAWMQQHGIEFHARSIFLQGLLLMPAHQRPPRFSRWANLWRAWHEWLSDNRVTALSACLGFATSNAGVARAVIGVDSPAHLEEIIGSAAGAPSKPVVPDDMVSEDTLLINPSKWSEQ
jgi:aryl-alcohol dehydrogenase-like predicted oxidoreductase